WWIIECGPVSSSPAPANTNTNTNTINTKLNPYPPAENITPEQREKNIRDIMGTPPPPEPLPWGSKSTDKYNDQVNPAP
ncbi:MAG: hypothetical protein Q8N69_00625, partial [bacterium]|nr:hypothetical protein [bacterium]